MPSPRLHPGRFARFRQYTNSRRVARERLGREGVDLGYAQRHDGYFRAVTVISTWAGGLASLATPTVVRAGRGSLKYVV